MPRIALATCEEYADLDSDDRPLLEALRARGADAEPLVWTRPHDPAAFDLIVLRSTWDYVPQRDRFLAWIARCPRLVNPAELVRWNTDKRYLAELASNGVPIVPTTFVAPGQPFAVPAVEHVVKPTISAGARDTSRHGAGAVTSKAAVAALHAAGRTAMVQPYVGSVDARGETALLFFDGAFSHAITKAALLPVGGPPVTGLFARETVTARAPTTAERTVAERVLDALPCPRAALAYARVDLVEGMTGPLLLELELTEPSLFLRFAPDGPARFADALLARARR